MKILTLGTIGFFSALLSSSSVHAEPITYQYIQTGISGPYANLTFDATITLEDPLAGLPTLGCTIQNGVIFGGCGSDDFGNVLSLRWKASPGFEHTLAEFTIDPFQPGGVFRVVYLNWAINPALITFTNVFETYYISGAGAAGPGSIRYSADGTSCSSVSSPPFFDTCVSTGVWTPVPEPASAVLIGLGMIGLSLLRRAPRRQV